MFCRNLVKRKKLSGDHKILYYLEQICIKTNMQKMERVLVYDFVCEFIKSSGNSTKKLEEFRKVANCPYKLKTDEGIEEIKVEMVMEKIERSLESEREEFGKMSEKFVMSFVCKMKEKDVDNEKEAWGQMIAETSEIQELKEKDELEP